MRSEPYFHLFGLPMGPPQFVAGFLLLCFLGQCAWLGLGAPIFVSATLPDASSPQAGARPFPPIFTLLVTLPVHLARWAGLSWGDIEKLLRLEFMATGALLGASIWYVARRLYAIPGGLAALILYCFSPMPFVVMRGTADPVPVAALGLFGVVFISIAVSHTLYALPRGNLGDEIRHRWRRVATLGLAIALMVGAAPELTFMLLVALGFMFYLAPQRRLDSLGLWAAACCLGTLVLLALGGPHWFARASFSPLAGWSAPRFILHTAVAGAAWTIMVIASAAAAVYVVSRRCRYFGNTAPLLCVFVTLFLGLPVDGQLYLGAFPAWSLPLLFVFVGGIFADLAETTWRRPAVLVYLVLAACLATLELLAVSHHPWTPHPRQLSSPERVRRVRIEQERSYESGCDRRSGPFRGLRHGSDQWRARLRHFPDFQQKL